MKQIITATVAVILICLVAIPLIDQSSDSVYSINENVDEKYMMADTGDNITITTDNNVIMNGINMTAISSTFNYSPIIITDQFIVAYVNNELYIFHDNARDRISSLEMTDGTATYLDTATSTTKNLSYGKAWFYTSDGEYCLYTTSNQDTSINVSKDTPYYVFPFNSYRESFGTCYGLYEYKNNEQINAIIPAAFSPTSPSSVPNAESVVINIKIDEESSDSAHYNINMNTTYTNATLDDVSVPADSLFFLVPVKYKEITQNDATIITILDLIPVLLIAALIVGIGYSIARRE